MALLRRLSQHLRSVLLAGHVPATCPPELWCRPATVLALRDPARARACLRGWR